MANMSYCRWQNTANDLSDCLDALEDRLSSEEHRARQRIVSMARTIVRAADNEEIPTKTEED